MASEFRRESAQAVPIRGHRPRKHWLLHVISLIGLAAGLYCLYRAVLPIITMYADVTSDPLGSRTGDPDVKLIQHEAFLWAPLGVVCLLVATVLSWIATAAWLRGKLGK